MRDEEVDLVRGQPRLRDRGERRRGERLGREAVGLLPLHPDEVLAAADRRRRGRALRPARREPDHVGAGWLGRHLDPMRHGRLLGDRDHDRTRPVAEEDARAAIGVIEEAGEELGADDEHVARHAGRHVGAGGGVRVDEARAGSGHVHRRRPAVPDRLLDERRSRRHPVVGRQRGNQDQVDLVGIQARDGDRARAGHGGHARGRLVRGGDPPLADARAADDPLVGGVDDPLEVGVREHGRRRI